MLENPEVSSQAGSLASGPPAKARWRGRSRREDAPSQWWSYPHPITARKTTPNALSTVQQLALPMPTRGRREDMAVAMAVVPTAATAAAAAATAATATPARWLL